MKWRPSGDAFGFLMRESLSSFMRHRGLEKAAVLAYNSFFALFPLMLLLLFVAGQFMTSSQAAMDAVDRLVRQMMPMFGDVVIREVQGLAVHKAWGFVSILVLLWGVMPLASAIRGAFDQIYMTNRALPFLKERLLDVVAVVLMLVLLILLVVGEIAYAVVAALIAHLAGKMPFVVRLTDVVVPLIITVVFLTIVHFIFAPKRLRLVPVLVGALVTAILLGLMGPLFMEIMRFNPDYGFAFGSLKAVFLLLVWVYSAFVVILLGIELTVNIQSREALLIRDLLTAPGRMAKKPDRLARHLTAYAPDEVLFREGEAGDVIYYVVSGSVTLSREGKPLRTMKAGEYFGEMAMLLKAPRTATATVSEPDTKLVTISAANMDAVLRQNPAIVLSLLREMAERLSLTDDLVRERVAVASTASPGTSSGSGAV
jgi:membrane protein